MIMVRYVEVPVPIPVTRIIEKPVPADAMFNSVIMDAYMSGQAPTINKCTQMCNIQPQLTQTPKMSDKELKDVRCYFK